MWGKLFISLAVSGEENKRERYWMICVLYRYHFTMQLKSESSLQLG